MCEKRFSALEALLDARVNEEVSKLVMHIDTNRAEFIDARDK